MWTIRKYDPSDSVRWDSFVRESRNGTFLFERSYMDYHSDRFRDHSLMAFKGERLVALLPANLDGEGVLHSHQGLTYGGWVLPPEHIDGADLLGIFEESLRFMRGEGIRELDYKPMPDIYCGQPSGEDRYALFRCGAELTECNLSSAINLREPLRYNKLRRRHLAKTSELIPLVKETEDAERFMSLVETCLRERHDTGAVHTAAEIELLHSRFPERIRMYVLETEGEYQAGTMIFDTGRVAHAQYIATTPLGRRDNLLTPLFHRLITEEYAGRAYFDFGISNEDHGLFLNEGLLRQKYSFGATGSAYTRYRLRL